MSRKRKARSRPSTTEDVMISPWVASFALTKLHGMLPSLVAKQATPELRKYVRKNMTTFLQRMAQELYVGAGKSRGGANFAIEEQRKALNSELLDSQCELTQLEVEYEGQRVLLKQRQRELRKLQRKVERARVELRQQQLHPRVRHADDGSAAVEDDLGVGKRRVHLHAHEDETERVPDDEFTQEWKASVLGTLETLDTQARGAMDNLAVLRRVVDKLPEE